LAHHEPLLHHGMEPLAHRGTEPLAHRGMEPLAHHGMAPLAHHSVVPIPLAHHAVIPLPIHHAAPLEAPVKGDHDVAAAHRGAIVKEAHVMPSPHVSTTPDYYDQMFGVVTHHNDSELF